VAAASIREGFCGENAQKQTRLSRHPEVLSLGP